MFVNPWEGEPPPPPEPTELTETAVDAFRPPAEAVTVEVPGLEPVTYPDPFTGATQELELLHANVTPGTSFPFASRATAVSWVPKPVATEADPGVTATDAICCVTETETWSEEQQEAATEMMAVPSPRAITLPLPSTVATFALELVQDAPGLPTTEPDAFRAVTDNCRDAPMAVSVPPLGEMACKGDRQDRVGRGTLLAKTTRHQLFSKGC